MEYFNSDGSTGSLCGNGARCAVKFADLTKRMKETKTKFISNGHEYSGEILSENLVKFNFGKPENLKLNFKVKAGGQLITAHFINTGSPHVVININEILKDPKNPRSGYSNINEVPVFQLGSEIRRLPEFLPEGTNVNFYLLQNDKIFIRTYERGVEDETLACGTGNAATAIILNRIEKILPPINLITRGGDELTVDFKDYKDIINNLALTGPVKIVFTGEILFNNILN
jgi:diaminopimelate epimerase